MVSGVWLVGCGGWRRGREGRDSPFIMVAIALRRLAGEGVTVCHVQSLAVVVHTLHPTPFVLGLAKAVFMVERISCRLVNDHWGDHCGRGDGHGDRA